MSFRKDAPLPFIILDGNGSGSSHPSSSLGSGDSTPYDLVTPRDSSHTRQSFGDIPMSPKKLNSCGAFHGHFASAKVNFSSPSRGGAQELTPDDALPVKLSAAKTLPFATTFGSPSSSRKRPQAISVDDVMHSGKKGGCERIDSIDGYGSEDDGIDGVAGELFRGSSAESHSPISDSEMLCHETFTSDDGVPSVGSIGGRKLLVVNSLTRVMSGNFQFSDHFYWLKKLGSGSFSHVWLCELKTNGEFFAVKADQRPLKGLRDRALHLREIHAVIEIGQHEYIVQYFRSWQEDRFFFSQMEFCEYGCLQQLCAKRALALGVGGRDWPVIGRIVHDTISGLAAIHSHNLLHLDIKPGAHTAAPSPPPHNLSTSSSHLPPGNIFICATGKLKIGDLGLCVRASSWDDEEGDRIYLARELLENKAGPHCDIFSAGVTFLELIQQSPAPKDGDKWHALRDGAVDIPDGTPESLRVLLLGMLHPDWSLRPTCADILKSDFLQAFNPRVTGALIDVTSLPCHGTVQELKPTRGDSKAMKKINAQDDGRHEFPLHMQHLLQPEGM